MLARPVSHGTKSLLVEMALTGSLGLGGRPHRLLLLLRHCSVDSVHASLLVVVDRHDEVLEYSPWEQVSKEHLERKISWMSELHHLNL